jgi:hypothetical protein
MKWFALLSLLVCAGCSTIDYTPYSGNQLDWPVADGAHVKIQSGIPFYLGLPDKPYQVLGSLVAVDASRYQLAQRCRALGGDAVMILDSKTVGAGSLNTPGYTHTSGTYAYGTYSAHSYTIPGASIPVTYQVTGARIIKFWKERDLQIARIQRFLAWADAHRHGYTDADVTYTAEQIKTRRQQFAAELDTLTASP